MKVLSCFSLLYCLIFCHQLSAQKFWANLTISEDRTAVDERVRFECAFPRHVMESASGTGGIAGSKVSVNLHWYGMRSLATQKTTCGEQGEVRQLSENSSLPTGRLLPPRNCTTMVLEFALDTWRLGGKFVCDVSFTALGMKHHHSSRLVRFWKTGDPTPPVTRFALINAATGVPIERGSDVPAGVRVSAVCESVPLKRPPPAITVSVTGGGVHNSHTPCARLELYATVPREPNVTFACRVFNGFGAPQLDEFSVTSVYGPTPGETVTLQEADTSADTEFLLCSVRNNPPRRLNITGFEPDVLQVDYPRFAEQPGLSLAFAKFRKLPIRPDGRLVTFRCGLEGMEPVLGAIRLTGPECVSRWC